MTSPFRGMQFERPGRVEIIRVASLDDSIRYHGRCPENQNIKVSRDLSFS